MPDRVKSITKSTFYTLLTQIPSHLFGIIAGIFIARTLGTTGRGYYAIFLATMTLYCTVFGGSITTSIIYFISSKKMEINKVNALSVLTLTATMLLTFLALTLSFVPSIQKWIIPDFPWNLDFAILMFSIIFLTQLNASFTAYFQGHQNFRLVNQILLLNSIYSLAGFAYLYWLGTMDPYIGVGAVLIMYRFILLLNTIHWLYHFFKAKGFHFNFNLTFAELKAFFQFTGYNHISEVGKFFNAKAILWIAAFFMSSSELGIFSIGLGVTSLLMLFSVPVSQILETYINGAKPLIRKQTFSRFARIQFTLLAIVVAIGSILIPYLIPLAYGAAFSTDSWVIMILLIGLLFGCQSNLLTSYFIASNRLKVNFWATYIGLSFLIIFGFVLVPKYGLLGAALTQTISFIAQFIFQIFVLRFKEDIPYSIHWMISSDIVFIKNQLKLIQRKG